MGRSMHVEKIIPIYLEAVKIEKGPFSWYNDSRWLKPLAEFAGTKPITSIGPRDLLAYRSFLASRYKVSTTNAYLMSAKRLVRFASENEYRGPCQLTGVRAIRNNAPPVEKAWPMEVVKSHLAKAKQFEPQLWAWLYVQCSGALRPSEVLALAHGKAEKVGDGVYKYWGKTSYKSGLHRMLILGPEAEKLIPTLKPEWKNWRTFWGRCDDIIDAGPHRFRHSCIQYLHTKLGVTDAMGIELFAGHYGVIKTTLKHYASIDWSTLRKYGETIECSLQ